jgi:uncharacterized protein (DUF427 family)
MPEHVTYVEPFPRRVRARIGGTTVLDSERVLLVHRQGAPPTYAFPAEEAAQVPHIDEPAAPGFVTIAWDAVTSWYEEEEEVFMHPRNPYHRVECVRTTRRLTVEFGGLVLVDTTDTVGVYETSLAPRLYVSPAHAAPGVLVPSPTTTYCPYKGTASYWSAVIGDAHIADVAWSYEEPYPECSAIRGLLSFYETRLDVSAEFPPVSEEA